MQINSSEMLGCCGTGSRGRSNFHMDTPLPPKNGSNVYLTRMLGHALSNKKLAGLKPEENNSRVMTRANNLASLTAAMLLQLEPQQRTKALIDIGGLSYAQHVLDFTEKGSPAQLPITDALRFSLALNFMLGIIDHEGGKSSFLSNGYVKFARLFKDAQDRRAGRPQGTTASASGLHGLGQGRPPTKAPAPVAVQTPVKRGFTTASPASIDPSTGAVLGPAGGSGDIDWSKVGAPPAGPAPVVQTGPSRDSNGACIRWTPNDQCFPQPPDIELDYNRFQADACGRTADQLVPTLRQKQIAKAEGIKRKFAEVFGRQPNNAELTMYGSMQWCASDFGNWGDPRRAPERWGDPMVAMTSRMIKVREDIEQGRLLVHPVGPYEGGQINDSDFELRDAGSDIAKSIKAASDAAFDFLGKAADFIADILCKGFKALFGPAVGGVICDIITFMTRMMVSGIAAIVDIVIESLKGTFEFIKLMIAGKVEAAFTALLRSMGNVLFSLSAPMMVPILMADKGKGRSMAQAFAELKVRAGRVMDKEPLWPIMVIMAVVGVFSAVSGNVLGAITGLITALAPMVATFISEPLKENIIELKTETLVNIEGGIGKFIKFVLLIFNGAMAIKDTIPKLRGQLADFMKKNTLKTLTGGNDIGAAARIKYVLDKFSAGVNAITAAFKNFNVKDIVSAAGPILAAIPDLLLAILPDDAAKAMPSLTEWKDAVKDSIADVNKREATLRAGAKEIFESYSFGTKVQVLQEQAAVLAQKPQDAAKVAAGIYAAQFKDKQNYEAFKAAFRVELLKA